MEELKKYIRNVPDFPIPGIQFKDVTTLFQDPTGFKLCIDLLVEKYKDAPITKIAGVDSRGFILGAALADRLGMGIVLIRKKGKLPAETIEESYALEYGEATLEIHTDAVGKGDQVLIIDDLLATGGTLKAAGKLVERLGAEVYAMNCIIELTGLPGRENLKGYRMDSFITYDEA